MSNLTLDPAIEQAPAKNRAHRGALAFTSLIAAGALMFAGGSAAQAADISTGSFDAVYVTSNGTQLEIDAHAHSGSFDPANDRIVIPSNGVITPSGPPSVGISSSGTPNTTDLELVSATYDDGTSVSAADIEVGGGNIFNTVAHPGSPVKTTQTIGSHYHAHPEWRFNDGPGEYQLTFQATDTSTGLAASTTYVLNFIQ